MFTVASPDGISYGACVSQIEIPSDLKPVDGRFGAGPSKARPGALSALAATGTSLLGTLTGRTRSRI
jgi:hypothetical protein